MACCCLSNGTQGLFVDGGIDLARPGMMAGGPKLDQLEKASWNVRVTRRLLGSHRHAWNGGTGLVDGRARAPVTATDSGAITHCGAPETTGPQRVQFTKVVHSFFSVATILPEEPRPTKSTFNSTNQQPKLVTKLHS